MQLSTVLHLLYPPPILLLYLTKFRLMLLFHLLLGRAGRLLHQIDSTNSVRTPPPPRPHTRPIVATCISVPKQCQVTCISHELSRVGKGIGYKMSNDWRRSRRTLFKRKGAVRKRSWPVLGRRRMMQEPKQTLLSI